MLSIQLLGPPHVALDQRPLNISRRKSRALLYYLAAHSVALSRDQILALLWPDHDRTAAQQLLRTTLYGLRKELGPALHVTDTTLALAPDTAIDLRRFERGLAALSEADDSIEPLAATLALYRGEFLAGFSLPDAEGFERWVAALRERTSQLAQHGYTILALRYEAHRDFSAAREVLARAIA
ncbi:MAG: transcriptional regulator, partial [Chloroflexi bacterium SZAS-1]|nr:transcriptional regulator [Chloroflexi bacterium SZAS-1]